VQSLDGSQQPFLVLGGPTVPLSLHRTKLTDFLVGGDQLRTGLLEAMKLGDLLLRFAKSVRVGKGFGDGLTRHSAGEAELGIMAGVMGFGAVAGRFTAAANDSGNGAGAQIASAEEILKEFGPFGLQSVEGIRHGCVAHSQHERAAGALN
jgi:hypothetical protein